MHYYDGWLLKLITLNKKYENSLKQIYFRVGYSKQFNLENIISKTSTLMVIFIREKKNIINELNMFTCSSYSYSFDKENIKVITPKSKETLEFNPEIFVFLLFIYYISIAKLG